VVALTGCGGSSSSSQGSNASGNPEAQQQSTSNNSEIPQGNAGDRDADNNGGPSDGDGGI